MATEFVEGNLLFKFGDQWTKVLRWDRHPAYLDGMGRTHQGKAVDFVGLLEGKVPFFIEVKDYRGRVRANEKGRLEHEFEYKLRSTAAALLGTRCRKKQDGDFSQVFQALLETRKVWLVLWLEEDRPHSTPGPRAARYRESQAGTLLGQIKQNINWLDAHPIVTSVGDPRRVVPDVIVETLPLERRAKAEKIIERFEARDIAVHRDVRWRLLDCIDIAMLDSFLERAEVERNPRRLFPSR